jgi:alkanesulfonate monooxygenase SsuD/methylene tetrahydromethanopterin reductase-like flavin-dependent oxidoreductase (luciferase family)
MIELWTQTEPQFTGAHCRIVDVAFLPKPVQEPHPPIWVGGNGLPAMRRAIRLGQAWMPNFLTPDEFAVRRVQLRELAGEHGRQASSLTYAVGCRFKFDEEATPTDRRVFVGRPRDMIDDVRRFEDAGVDKLIMLGAPTRDVDALVVELERFANEVVAKL